MKRLILLLITVCMICVSGCTDQEYGEDSTNDQETAPDASELFTQFTETDNYNDWNIWPGEEAMMEGTGVHGDHVTIYVSDNAFPVAETGGEEMPYETIVVKEGFDADDELIGFYVMYKKEAFDPSNNDWFWASYSPEGDVKAEGKVNGCINCHAREKEADYIFSNA